MKETLKKSLLLFLTFFKIGITTFGGGYAMIPIFQNEFIDKKGWIKEDEMMRLLAIAESTPGPIAINMATFIGYRTCKFLGSLFATLGVVLPSFIIMLIISLFLNNLMEFEIVQKIFSGIRLGVAVLILWAGINMFKSMTKSIYNIVIFALALGVLIALEILAINFSSIYLILIAMVFGVVYTAFTKVNKKEPISSDAPNEDEKENDSKKGGNKE